MEINLPPAQEAFVRKGVETGLFSNAEDAIEQAVGFFQKYQDNLEELRAEIQIGIDELDRGEGIELDEESTHQLFEDIHRRGMERLARERDNAAE